MALEEVQFADLNVTHIGRKVHVQYGAKNRYEIGTILGVSSDFSSIKVLLEQGPVTGLWNPEGAPSPRLWLHVE